MTDRIDPPKVRFAPSPTGFLHIGNARAALLNWLFARHCHGRFMLRIDDTDKARSTAAFEQAIREDLEWLGLNWDDEARQSDRFARYDAVVEKLKEDGRLYPCFETEEELDLKRKLQRAQGLPPVYDRAALDLSASQIAAFEAEGRQPHWRFKLETPARVVWDDLIRGEQSIDMESLSDPVLVRADGTYLYSLPSVVDDIDFGISHVVRGEDHVTNSAVQVQIFEALGAEPPRFAHFSLLQAREGSAFSKREGGGGLRDLRQAGIEPMAVVSYLAHIGTSRPVEAVLHHRDLIGEFTFSAFSRAPTKVDMADLEQLNTRIVHALPHEAVADRLGLDAPTWDAIRPNISRLSEAADWVALIEGPVTPEVEDGDSDYIAEALAHLPEGPLGPDSWRDWTAALKETTGRNGKALFMPLRKVLTGQGHGPDMAALVPLIGRVRVRERLEAALK